MKKIRQRKGQVGDIVAIDLGNGYEGYGCVLDPPLVGFYGIETKERLSIDEIVKNDFIFKIFVYDDAIKSGRWKIIGSIPLGDGLRSVEKFFKQDVISKKLSIYIDGGPEVAASKEECIGLEAAAIWAAEHVEDRIRDYIAGVENRWAKIINTIK